MGTATVEADTTVIMAIVAEDEEVAGATRKRLEVKSRLLLNRIVPHRKFPF